MSQRGRLMPVPVATTGPRLGTSGGYVKHSPGSVTTPSSNNTISIIALVIAILAFLFLIVLFFIWLFSRRNDNNNPSWKIVIGKANGSNTTVDTFTPDGSDIYMVSALSSAITLNIKSNGSNLTGRLFMIDNTGNTQAIMVKGSGITLVDKIGNLEVQPHSTGTYMWTSSTTAKRLN